MPELIPAEPGTPGWLAARRQGVTATDIASILGIGYKSAYWVYWNKLGQVPDEPDSDRFRLGRELEPYVWGRWYEVTGDEDSHTYPAGLWRSSERPWALATLDALYKARPVELKTWADADRHSWTDGPPAKVRAQVLWQMDVMDVGTGHVGVVFLPSGEFRSYVIEHDDVDEHVEECDDRHAAKECAACQVCADLDLMRVRGAEFYARLQGELPPPGIDASAASLAAVKARFGDARKNKTAPVDEALWDDYSAACDSLDGWQRNKRDYENQIREQIGEASVIEVDGRVVARRRVYDSPVKAHTRHVDGFWRVEQTGDDSE